VSVDNAPAVEIPIHIARRVVAEAVGTAVLLAVVVGSGIMGKGCSRRASDSPCSRTRSLRAADWSR
jgi:glycerol uptake facilitator-like aquaporin